MPCKACHKPKTKTQELKRPVFEKGRRYFRIDGTEYICAQVGPDAYTLVNLTDGHYWDRPKPLEDMVDGMTMIEFNLHLR